MSAAKSGTSQGNIAIVVRSTDSFAVRDSTNSTVPSGGGKRPDIRFSTITSPKWTRAMPSFWQIGGREGTGRGVGGGGPRKQPTTGNSTVRGRRDTHGAGVNRKR